MGYEPLRRVNRIRAFRNWSSKPSGALSFALDHDQAANAAALQAQGGAEIIEQKHLTPDILSQKLIQLIETPQSLADMAKAAKDVGKPHAAEALADSVERVALKGSQI